MEGVSNRVVVYRYILHTPKAGVVTKITIPRGAKILNIEVKIGDKFPSIWAMVDPTEPDEERAILILPTGIEVPTTWNFIRYINTFQIDEGGVTLCFHAFEQSLD